MTDRAREGLFSSIVAWIPGADVLDLYAGSGSLGLEALSRGAASATFVEHDRGAIKALADNVELVGLGGRVVTQSVESFLARDRGMYDVVFVDPPYAVPFDSVTAIMVAIAACVRDGGLVILHRRVGEPRPEVEGLVGAGERAYGTAQLWRYERRGAAAREEGPDGESVGERPGEERD
jgi:16S rRNA (guanine966-N2)-methyltransferase